MFDIGLLELLLIAVISLLVLGPERLPGAVRSGAKTIYWFKRRASNTKKELNEAFDLNEAYQDSRNEKILEDLEEKKD
jgi:sec-independent protein translocase protein TatB